MNVDQELMLNRILDKYGEWMRIAMRPRIREQFDALTPEQRRGLITEKLNEESA